MHHREKHLTSNTANLAKLVLPNCQIAMRGLPNAPFHIDMLNLKPNEEELLYLFPHEGAAVLSADYLDTLKHKKFHLIVPDGSWSQAVKFYRREPSLAGIQCVTLPEGNPGKYRLRKASNENKLSTFEAIARALGILEYNPNVTNQMEDIFNIMVESVIRGRTAFEN